MWERGVGGVVEERAGCGRPKRWGRGRRCRVRSEVGSWQGRGGGGGRERGEVGALPQEPWEGTQGRLLTWLARCEFLLNGVLASVFQNETVTPC